MSRTIVVQARRPVDFILTGFVQSFMLLQVGFFDLLRRFRGWRLKRESLIKGRSSREPLRTALQTISVVVPAFNEARSIGMCLETLERHASSLKRVQVVVVDAGCKDDTMAIVTAWAAQTKVSVLTTTSSGGRGPAVAAGTRLSVGDAILVLHADTALPANWDGAVLEALADPTVLMTAFSFGCDRAQLSCPESPPAGLALMEWTVNRRSRWYELPFGDQALATTRATLDAIGGYPETCILEEFILVNRLRAMSAAGLGRILTLDATALCSPRRWERSTVWRINAVNQAVYYLPPDGLASLHFVGRFERLQPDYAHLLSNERFTQHSRPQLAHLRPAVEGGRPRLEWARSEELAALVREVYRSDYELLGYDVGPVEPSIGRASDTM